MLIRIFLSAYICLSSCFLVSNAMATEEPKYTVLEQSEPFELRAYAPMLVAEVRVSGDLDSASSEGFKQIAAYIFGQNKVSQKIAMTTPITMESSENTQSAKIAMTAPVIIETDQSLNKSSSKEWTVAFVMPSEYTMETLPKPLNSKIVIKEIPGEKKAVIVFSGFYDNTKVNEMTRNLESWMQSKGLQADGVPQFARYNPPWTLPFMRRNEVMIRVKN
jgi:effector-binding domain-containing protein